MRKAILILGLAAVTLLASGSDAFAQRRGGDRGGRGGDGWRSGYNNSRYYGGYGYYRPYYYSGGYGYYSPDYYGSTAPDNYYSDSVNQPPATDIRQSGYAEPASATITVLVPSANAQIWFDGSPTTQRGTERIFYTPALQQGGTYTIRAKWTENGRNMDQDRQVQVRRGQSVSVTFGGNSGESLPPPRTPRD